MSKEKTAEQMFAELGYNICKKFDWAIFLYKYGVEIAFYLKEKTFAKFDGEIAVDITVEELKAINKQCEELGWLSVVKENLTSEKGENMKTITIKQIPFPTWEEFEKKKALKLNGTCITIGMVRVDYGRLKLKEKQIVAYLETKDEYFKIALDNTQQGYTEACEFLQEEWEKLIESMASLCEGE